MSTGRAIAGAEVTTANINDQCPDQSINDIRRVVNSGRAYFDAGWAAATMQARNGLTLEASYWFSKAIDTGSDYLSTAYDLHSFRAGGSLWSVPLRSPGWRR
ncbi:MAG: hypothetical protein JNL98_04040 [Bryobacterales bacterium]|nr:hypothetical protein [Bryobacterales bacterium]